MVGGETMINDTIRLRWLYLSHEAFKSQLVAEIRSSEGLQRKKKELLKTQLGIEVEPGESALQAWLRVMAQENGLPVMEPATPELVKEILSRAGALQFVWALA